MTVEAWTGDTIALHLSGSLVHPRPVAHALVRPWIPLRSVAEVGERIEQGAAVAELESDIVTRWADNDRLQLSEQEAQNARDRLSAEQRLADLSGRREQLAAGIAVLDAEISALAMRDTDQIAIARRELADAQQAFSRAKQTRERTRALHDAGFASASAVAAADNDAALTGAAVTVPEYALLLLEHGSTALTRRQKQLDRAQQAAQLDGIDAQLAALRQAMGAGAVTASRDLARAQGVVAKWDEILADPVVRALASGIVTLKDASIRAGVKPSQAPFAYVLDDVGMVAEVVIADRLRSFVVVGASVAVHINALDATLAGRVTGVAAAPEPLADGSGRGFRCRIAVLSPDERARPGMAVQCAVSVDLAGRAPLAVIPTWVLNDRLHPAVRLADGSRRDLDAVVVGRQVVVFSGITPGDVVTTGDLPQSGQVRLAGTLDPAHFLPLRAASGQQRWDAGWELIDMLPDGADVEAGAVVATLAKVGWGDVNEFRIDAEVAEIMAASRLAQARADALASLAGALSDWRAATQAAERARLDLHIALLESSDSRQVATAAAVVRAEVALRRAHTAAEELSAPGASTAYSTDEQERRRSELARAELGVRRAAIEATAARRATDHATVVKARAGVLDMEDELDNQRGTYLIARLQGQQQVAGAQLAWRDERARQKGNREQATGETLRAPRAGRVFQRPDQNGRLVRIGDRLEGREAFIMPLDDRRLLEVEVPARFYGRFVVGATVPVMVPALGPAPRSATVVAVAAYFADPVGAKDERTSHGSVGVPERVFRLSLGVELTLDDARRAPPGSTAYVDL